MIATTDRAPGATTGSDVGARVLLVAAPLLMALGRALLVPLDDEDWDSVLTSVADHQGRSDAGWLLAIAASGLLAATAVLLARRVALGGRPRTATFVTVTTAVGWAATAATCLTGLYLGAAAGAPDRAEQVRIQQDFNEGSIGVVFLMTAIAAIGYLVLAVSLARTRTASRSAAALIGIGGPATLLTMAGPLRPLLVLAALVLAAGHAVAAQSP